MLPGPVPRLPRAARADATRGRGDAHPGTRARRDRAARDEEAAAPPGGAAPQGKGGARAAEADEQDPGQGNRRDTVPGESVRR